MSNFSTKIASTVSVAALVATAMSASLVSAASEFLTYAELLADHSVIGTQSNESGYRLGDTVTRAELAKITANLGEYPATSCVGTTYSDVNKSLGDLCGYIEALAEAGVISTANANFRPNAPVTRAEATKMLLGAVGETGSSTDAGYTDTASLGDLAMYINRANELGCAADATFFRPNATASRGEAFKLAACIADLMPTTPPTSNTGVTNTGITNTGVVVPGAVSVAIDGTAVAQYVPKNASSVKVGAIKLTAGTTDVTVTSVTVTRSGLGNTTGISLSLGQSGTTLSELRSLNSTTQEAIVRLNNAVTIKAGTTVSLDVLASFSASSSENNQHQFTVTAVGTSAGVTGTPVTLGLLNTTSYTVASANVASITTVSSITSGNTAQRIANVKIDAGSNRDTRINGFTLSKENGEDYTKTFANMSVYRNSTKVGTVSMTSDKIYVTGLNITLLAGETADFELRADTIYVGTDSTTSFKMNDSTDVSATEIATGYSTQVTGTPYAAQTLQLVGIQVTWTKSSTGSKTVAPGTSSVVLFDGRVTSSASFDVTKYTLTATPTFTAIQAATAFSRLVLTVDGVETDLLTVANPSNVAFSATADKFRVESGKSVIVKVTGTLKSNAPTTSYKFTMTLTEAKNVNNGNVAPLNIAQTGDNVTVSVGKATFQAATIAAPSTKKITANTTNSEIGRFSVLAEAEDITVRKLVFANATTTAGTPATPAVTGVTGVAEVSTVTAAGTAASVTTATTAGTVSVNVNGATHSVAVAVGDTAAIIAGKIATAIGATASVAGTTVTVTNSVNGNVADATATPAAVGNATIVAGTTTNGGVAVAEVSTFDVAVNPITSDTFTVTVNGTTTAAITVNNGDSAATVAGKIAMAVGGTTSVAGSVATLTAATTGVQTDIVLSKSSVLGVTLTAAVTTQGVTAVAASAGTPAIAGDITDLRNLVSGSAVKLYDAETGVQLSQGTVTITATTITVDGLSLIVAKDTTKNVVVRIDTTDLSSLGGTNFTLRVVAPAAGDITRQSSGDAALVGSVVSVGNTTGEFVAGSSTYAAGKVPPVVTIAKSGTDLDTYIVTVRNIDSENPIIIDNVTLKAKSRFAGATAVTWDGNACIRNGSTGQCNVSGLSTAAQMIGGTLAPNGATFTLSGVIPNLNLVKNTGTISFNVYVPNLPALISGDTLEISVATLGYDTTSTEDYTSVAGAKVTATK